MYTWYYISYSLLRTHHPCQYMDPKIKHYPYIEITINMHQNVVIRVNYGLVIVFKIGHANYIYHYFHRSWFRIVTIVQTTSKAYCVINFLFTCWRNGLLIVPCVFIVNKKVFLYWKNFSTPCSLKRNFISSPSDQKVIRVRT